MFASSAACAVRCRGCRSRRSRAGTMRNGRMSASGSARSSARSTSSSAAFASPSASRASASRRSALMTEKSRTIGAVPARTGASTSIGARASRSASMDRGQRRLASRRIRALHPTPSPAPREPPAGRRVARASAPGAREPGSPVDRMTPSAIGAAAPRRTRRAPRRAVPGRDAGSLGRSARATPWRARRSVEAPARRDPATAAPRRTGPARHRPRPSSRAPSGRSARTATRTSP